MAGTNGEGPVISGDRLGTNGEGASRPGLIARTYLIFGGLAALICVVNIGSRLIESPPGERAFQTWEPVLWEVSSLIALVSLLWLWPLIYQRFHYARVGRWRFAVIQGAAFLAFTLSHIGIMVALRSLTYRLIGWRYDFARGDLFIQIVYEARKDALGYLGLLALFWVFERLGRTEVAKADARLEVRDGTRTVFIAPKDVLWIEAAGNYVEIHTASKTWLMRGVLSAYETRLKPDGFVRVHRSRLVNRTAIDSLQAVPSGDFRLTLSDGRVLVGSRRYRSVL